MLNSSSYYYHYHWRWEDRIYVAQVGHEVSVAKDDPELLDSLLLPPGGLGSQV